MTAIGVAATTTATAPALPLFSPSLAHLMHANVSCTALCMYLCSYRFRFVCAVFVPFGFLSFCSFVFHCIFHSAKCAFERIFFSLFSHSIYRFISLVILFHIRNVSLSLICPKYNGKIFRIFPARQIQESIHGAYAQQKYKTEFN